MQKSSSRRRERQARELNLLLANWPALAAYISRVGAITRNFKSHAIQEMDEDSGYWRDRVRIKVESDGTISVTVIPRRDDPEEIDAAQFEPTASEQEQIKAEAAKGYPHSSHASELPPDLVGVDPEELLIYRDPDEERLIEWIQWRKLDQEGKPYYVPYTKWSDGEWRTMEPDGLLPLYGRDQLKHGKAWLVMVHEGGKCARHVQRLVDNNVDHPWLPELRRYVHLGWPGGVNSADRVDWGPIKRLEWDRDVVLVCDNDVSGIDVASTISRLLQRSLSMIKFDERFPESFDLADDWPKNERWWRGKRYVGPMPDDCMYSATWATAPVKPSMAKGAAKPKGKPAFKIVKPFEKEWLWAEELDVFINRRQLNQMRRREIFNSRVISFSDVEDTARLLLKSNWPKCDGVAYEPDEQQGVINVGGRRLINTYRPSEIEPIAGDATPFIEFMGHLFPIERERKKVLAWMTTLVCRPDVRMRFGVLLISLTQGVGKTTLAQDILVPLIGEWNASFPDETTILTSAFTSWIAHKRLAVVHEICTDDKTKKVYNRLKSIITETIVDVNEKYLKPYTIKNWIHVLACSNTKRALYLDDVDRRWFLPLVTERLLDEGYWTGLHKWLREDGLGIILHHLMDLAKDPAYIIGTGEHAPASATKEEVIEESRSPGEQIAFDAGRNAVEATFKVVYAVDGGSHFCGLVPPP